MTDWNEAVLDVTRKLIRMRSVTPDDAGCQALLGETLVQLGFEVEHMPFGKVDNLWARRGNHRPLLCFAGHTDVVPPGPAEQWEVDPFNAEVRDGRLVARGAADMKSGLAAMLVGCQRFVGEHPDHPARSRFWSPATKRARPATVRSKSWKRSTAGASASTGA